MRFVYIVHGDGGCYSSNSSSSSSSSAAAAVAAVATIIAAMFSVHVLVVICWRYRELFRYKHNTALVCLCVAMFQIWILFTHI